MKSNRRKMIGLVLATVAVAVFFILPVNYQELYRCPVDAEVCIALYSSEITTTQLTALIRLTAPNDYEAIAPDTIRNASILLVPVTYWAVLAISSFCRK